MHFQSLLVAGFLAAGTVWAGINDGVGTTFFAWSAFIGVYQRPN